MRRLSSLIQLFSHQTVWKDVDMNFILFNSQTVACLHNPVHDHVETTVMHKLTAHTYKQISAEGLERNDNACVYSFIQFHMVLCIS